MGRKMNTSTAQRAPTQEIPWKTHCHALAAWAMERLVNRIDRHGEYAANGPVTAGSLSDATLQNHFAGVKIAGLHSTSSDGTCKWLAIDFDNHAEDSDVAISNFDSAMQICNQLTDLDVGWLLENSDGQGGFHIWILMTEPAPVESVYRFGQWLIDGADLETYPLQSKLSVDQIGNWLRLPGHHHTRDHWSCFWGDGEWLDAQQSIDLLLKTPTNVQTILDLVPADWQSPDDIAAEDRARRQAEYEIRRKERPVTGDDITDNGVAVCERYIDDIAWQDLLHDEGWELNSEDGAESTWTRPGKLSGVSASLNHNGNNLLNVFSSEANVPTAIYGKFRFWAFANGFTDGSQIDAADKYLSTHHPDLFAKRQEKYRPRGKGELATIPDDSARGDSPQVDSDKAATAVAEIVDAGTSVTRPYTLSDRNDIGNGSHFVRQHGHRVRYVHDWGKWLVWDGLRWKLDNDGTPLRLAQKTVTAIFHEGAKQQNGDILALAVQSAKLPRMSAMLTLATTSLGIPHEELDTHSWLLNCTNGTLNLRTNQIHPHQQSDKITKLCPTAYVHDAACPKWDKFLSEVFVDDDLITFVQRLLGYCLTGEVSEQKLPIFYGAGANGKTTLLNAVMETIGGDYTMQAKPDFLMAKKHDADLLSLTDLFGKRFVSCAESEESKRLAEATVKSLTGGDRIRARRHYENLWEFSPTHKLILCTNYKPIIKGTDHGIWRRLMLVPFSQSFKGKKDNKKLPKTLGNEAEGILAWLVRGCMDWQKTGLNPPERVVKATDEYRSQEDIIGRFLEERCQPAKSLSVRFSVLYQAFESWCEDTGDFCPSKRKVGSWLTDQGYKRFTANGSCYRGLKLKAAVKAAAESTERSV